MYEPKTASETARFITLTERARQIIADGYTFSTDAEVGITYVCKPGRLASDYELFDGKCTCPARQRERFCKHEIAVALIEAETEMWEEICAEYERTHEAPAC
jgi:hypothetical protein